MVHDPAVEAYWQGFLATLPPDTPRPAGYSAWGFGDSPEMADDLGALVREGTKTATCGLLWEYEADGDPLPQVGEYSVITGGDGSPLCIIETTEVVVRPFNMVDAQFAYDEGEGDRSYAYWRAGHWRFFSRVCKRIGRQISETMPVVCERFRVVYRG